MPPIRTFPDPVLRERSRPVARIGDSVRRLIRNLAEAMYEQPDGVGLAAPQLGVLRRVFVYDIGDGLGALVNPVIEHRSGSSERIEGCLSIPGMAYSVVRPERVVVHGLDASGAPVRFEADGLLARVVQHEVDHLDGVLFVDRLEAGLRAEAVRRFRERLLEAAPIAS